MMEKLKFLGMGALVSLLTATSACGDSDLVTQGEKGMGRMSVFADLNTSVISSRSDASRANADAVDASVLHLVLTSVDGQNVYDLGTLGEYDQTKTFPVGNYYLEASYGDQTVEGFEMPCYYGKSDVVRIADGETTQVGVSAGLANSMFTITYTEALTKYLVDYSAEVQSAGSAVPVKFAKDETRAAYVRPGDVDIYVNVTKPNGSKARLLAASVTAEPRYRYNVTIDMNDGEVGEGAITITFDENLVAEDVTIDLSDELMNAPAPSLVLGGDAAIDYVETTTNKTPVKYNVIAKGMLAKVILNTTNASAVAPSWPEQVDLLKADAATRKALTDLGLDVLGLWKNPDKMAVVDLTKVVSNITDNGSPVVFSLTVVDRMGKTNETDLPVTVNVSPISFSVDNIGDLLIGSTTLSFTLNYNGDDPTDVKYFYKNERGTTSQASVASIEAAGDGKYNVTLNVPLEDDFVFYATNGKIQTPEYTAPRIASLTYKAELTDAFAHSATIAVTETEAPNAGASYAQFATVFLSTNGADYAKAPASVAADGLKLSSLSAGTHYYAKVSLSGRIDDSKAFEFDTEEATALASLADWTFEGGNANWSLAVPRTPWATLNPLTTSEPGSTSAAWNAVSGTTPAASGRGAVIATVGWGASNTAATRGSLFQGFQPQPHCSNVTVGELYLGAFDTSAMAPAYGVDFASRPSSLSFSYTYTAKAGGDEGTAYIAVLDASGNILAKAEKNLSAQSQATAVTMALEYESAVKAASLQLIFRSSKGGYTAVNSTNLNFPEVGTSDQTQRYYGSELCVEDVTLNY